LHFQNPFLQEALEVSQFCLSADVDYESEKVLDKQILQERLNLKDDKIFEKEK